MYVDKPDLLQPCLPKMTFVQYVDELELFADDVTSPSLAIHVRSYSNQSLDECRSQQSPGPTRQQTVNRKRIEPV